jgi:hypothetical protein
MGASLGKMLLLQEGRCSDRDCNIAPIRHNQKEAAVGDTVLPHGEAALRSRTLKIRITTDRS